MLLTDLKITGTQHF